MLYGPIGKRAWAGLFVLASALIAGNAHADIGPCTGIGTGGPTCPPPTPCTDDATCFGAGLGRCAGGNCSPNCGSLFQCNSVSDCPRFDPLVPTCQRVALTGANGLCIYADATANRVTTLCAGSPSTVVMFSVARACFSAGPDWSMGDCDGDHTPNGTDGDPCDPSNTSVRAPTPNPFCLPGRVCEGATSVCAPILRCSSDDPCIATAGHISATGPWQCLGVPGVASVHVCQPSCNATAQCTGAADCGPFGMCVASAVGGLSFCESARIASCRATCMTRTLDWTSPNGDCDGDGAQNGCDNNPCNGSAADPHCVANAPICTLPDAGVPLVDAGNVMVFDAGRDAGSPDLPDAGNPQEDAFSPDVDASVLVSDGGTPNRDGGATPMDGGGTGIDAGTTEITPGLGFGGGGGCRCAAPGGGSTSSSGTAVVALALASWLVRRRRR